MSESRALTPSAAFRALSEHLQQAATIRPMKIAAVSKALDNSETPGEDEDVLAPVAELELFIDSLEEEYEAAAKALDVAGGSVSILADVPVTSKCLRLEARFAPFMSGEWLRARAELWGVIADEAAAKEGAAS